MNVVEFPETEPRLTEQEHKVFDEVYQVLGRLAFDNGSPRKNVDVGAIREVMRSLASIEEAYSNNDGAQPDVTG